MKSILQYIVFQTDMKEKDIALPAPHGPFSSKVQPEAIKAANERALSKLQNHKLYQ